MVFLRKDSKFRIGWRVSACFSIHLHNKDLYLIERIQAYFKGVGGIRVNKKDLSVNYSVTSLKDLIDVIIPHFDAYPLLTQKNADYLLFKKVVYLMEKKEHLTYEGLRNIVSIRAVMNNGLTDVLLENFTDLILIERPEVELKVIEDPNWIVGFVDGEGSFGIVIAEAPGVSTGYSVSQKFTITQHVKDHKLLESFAKYFDCGWVQVNSKRPLAYFHVSKFSDIYHKINTFFLKYPLESEKSKDFKDFLEASYLIKSQSHLTLEGLKQIRDIKLNMNRGRKSPISE